MQSAVMCAATQKRQASYHLHEIVAGANHSRQPRVTIETPGYPSTSVQQRQCQGEADADGRGGARPYGGHCGKEVEVHSIQTQEQKEDQRRVSPKRILGRPREVAALQRRAIQAPSARRGRNLDGLDVGLDARAGIKQQLWTLCHLDRAVVPKLREPRTPRTFREL